MERKLNGILQEIARANGLGEVPINCRVLLTTPAELFSVDNTVLISRGLLNLVPDESTLAGLLALEVAHVTLNHTDAPAYVTTPIFDSRRKSDFPGFGSQRSSKDEDSAPERMRSMLREPAYAESASKTELFLRELAGLSSNVPHLASGRFGLPHASARQVTGPEVPLRLGGNYGISSWEDRIVAMDKTLTNGPASAAMSGETRPRESTTSDPDD